MAKQQRPDHSLADETLADGSRPNPGFLQTVLLTGMAGGMGWGIRGQYGHETGAMIAGVLVGLTLVLLLFSHLSSRHAARAVALFVMGISLGGSMTYGQTLGLTQNPTSIGNWAAWRWGMFGVFLKGGIWIGLAGAFLGMGVGGKRYRPSEGFLLLAAMLALWCAGIWLLNRPFDPAHKLLPRIYFSADWYWEPNADIKPRPECWGGLLLALLGLSAYLLMVRRDRFACRLAAVGFLAGGIGFSLGQSIQSAHAWNPELFRWGPLAILEPHVNWWNMMEITFGATFASIVAGALWWQRPCHVPPSLDADSTRDDVTVSPIWEGGLLAVYGTLLVAAEFLDVGWLGLFLQTGLVMGLLPMIAVLGGQYGPYFYVLPIVTLPIAGKTLNEMVYENAEISPAIGWTCLAILPIAVTSMAAWWLARRGRSGGSSVDYARVALTLSVVVFWSLNFVVFRFPWPWQPWTGRTPSALIFTVCAFALIVLAVRSKDDVRTRECS